MPNFFDQVREHNQEQKHFSELSSHHGNVIVSAPVGYPSTAIYGLSAVLRDSLVIIVCPYVFQVEQRNAYFQETGLTFPQVAMLHEEQAPHEQRATLQMLNTDRVKILCVTAGRFSSLSVLQVLVHIQINLLIVEEADRFLPLTGGDKAYQRFRKEGLAQLRELPHLALLTGIISSVHQERLIKSLSLESCDVVKIPYNSNHTQVEVCCHLTGKQKLNKLVKTLNTLMGKNTEKSIIQLYTRTQEQAEWVGQLLNQTGFHNVSILGKQQNATDLTQLKDALSTHMSNILIGTGECIRWSTLYCHLASLEKQPAAIIFWNLPTSLDELAMETLAIPSMYPLEDIEQPQPFNVLILHTKEDFEEHLAALQQNRHTHLKESQEKITLLRQLREWLLSNACRMASLRSYVQTGIPKAFMSSCGHCDQCRSVQPGWLWWLKYIYRLIY